MAKKPLKTVCKKPNNKVKRFATYSINKGLISLIYNKFLEQRKSPKFDGKTSKRFGQFTKDIYKQVLKQNHLIMLKIREKKI